MLRHSPDGHVDAAARLASTLDSAHHISDELHAMGVKDFFLRVFSGDAAGLERQHMHPSSYLETPGLR
jgi:hypothetical protein